MLNTTNSAALKTKHLIIPVCVTVQGSTIINIEILKYTPSRNRDTKLLFFQWFTSDSVDVPPLDHVLPVKNAIKILREGNSK